MPAARRGGSQDGGDEFVVLERYGGLERAGIELTARKLLRVLAESIEVDGIRFQISASIGVSLYPEHGRDFEILSNADLAMFRAKSEQRDAFRIFEPPLAAAAETRITLMSELRSAIDARQFEVFYQPRWRSIAVRCWVLRRWCAGVTGSGG